MISIEQLEALQALHQSGTYMAAAKQLHKSYGSINYLIQSLERDIGLSLLDRNQYRTRLNAHGKALLLAGEKMLGTQRDLMKLCQNLKKEWEPELTLVYDGILPIKPLVEAVMHVKNEGATTKINTIVGFHEEVETKFTRLEADMMLSISPPKVESLPSIRLEPFGSTLVAASSSALAKGRWTLEGLKGHSLITVRGSSSRLGMSTLELEQSSNFTVGDFFSKKEALLCGAGFGWMPDFLIQKELRKGSLVRLQTDFPNRHKFSPRLYHRPVDSLGKASRLLMERIQQYLRQE